MTPLRSLAWIVLALLLLAAPASAQTFDATNRGWFNSGGAHTATNLTAFVGQGAGTTRFHGFFVFDLGALAAPVGSGVLRLELEAFLGPDASEVFSVYDVTSNVADLLVTQSGRTDIYSDLGSGIAYGTGVALRTDVGSVIEVELTPEAVAALNAAAGARIALGVAVESLRLPSGSEGVRFSFAAESRVHQLVLSEAPSTLDLEPALAGATPPASHTVSAAVADALGVPTPGAMVSFSVVAGPHAGGGGDVATDANGEALFTYAGSAAGVDQILATFTDAGGHALAAQAHAFWGEDCNGNAVPDVCDLACDGFDGACAAFVECGGSVDADANGEPDECFVAPPPPPPSNAAPDCSAAAAQPALMRKPDRRMREVSVVGVSDPDGDPVQITIDDVFQDEITDTRKFWSTCPDVLGLGSDSVKLRAERRGFGDGRVYHVDFSADDGHGGVCTGSVTVCVPRDDRRSGASCVDQGPLYDSATCLRRPYHGHRRGHHGHGGAGKGGRH